MTFDERITEFNKMLADAKRIVVFTGAGASTGAGLPDFRSADGLYNKVDEEFKDVNPETILSAGYLASNPERFFRYLFKEMNFTGVTPAVTHTQIGALGKVREVTVITQNIDGLHQLGGSEKVYEMHGTLAKSYCVNCLEEFEGRASYNEGKIPVCPHCGGMIRPDVVLYDEAVRDLMTAFTETHKADLLIVVGSSLTVYPAAYVPMHFYGENMVIINKEPTSMDIRASLIFREECDEVFEAITIPEN